MTLPDFLIIGAQKSGTSWLRHQLARHPGVFVYRHEIRYFNTPRKLDRGAGWYARHFDRAEPRQIVGEKTPGYMCANLPSVPNPRAHESMHELLPRAKLIAILREPVARAISAFNHHARRGRLRRAGPIDDLLLGRDRRLEDRYGFFHRGLYAQQLRALLELYPRDQLLVLTFEEDVRDAPGPCLARVSRFLGVADDFPFPEPERNVSGPRSGPARLARRLLPGQRRFSRWVDDRFDPPAPRPSPACREELRARYAPHNEELFRLIGRRIDAWERAWRSG